MTLYIVYIFLGKWSFFFFFQYRACPHARAYLFGLYTNAVYKFWTTTSRLEVFTCGS